MWFFASEHRWHSNIIIRCSILLGAAFPILHSQADSDYASLVKNNIKIQDRQTPSKITALAYGSAGNNPLTVSREDFREMYEDNQDIWGDMDEHSASLNYLSHHVPDDQYHSRIEHQDFDHSSNTICRTGTRLRSTTMVQCDTTPLDTTL